MAQNKYSVNLSAASYTLSFYYKGPSVIIPGQDQNYFQATSDWAGNTPTRGINIPQVMYLENTVPTAQGYKSVAYRWFIEPAEPLFQRFTKVFPIFEGTGASALLGLTADRKLYILSAETSGKWQAVVWDNTAGSPPAWDTPDQVSTATVVGACLICIQGVGIFQVNFITGTLKYVIPTGIDGSLINGICSASGYTIAWDDTTIYWSSTEDPLDFVPSLISGAGSSKVMGLKGNIHLCKEISNGFIIYSDITLIAAAYTANQALPFTFTILAGSSGIRSERAVSSDINAQVHFAWTTGGLVAVELNRATPMFPELTDFIASEMSDDTYELDKYPQINNYPGYKEVYVVVVSNRYLCISFGTAEDPLANEYVVPKMEQSFVYDLQLKRWGKLNVDHVQIIESPFTAQEPVDFLVSHLYPHEQGDYLDVSGLENIQEAPAVLDGNYLTLGGLLNLTADLRDPLRTWTNWPQEPINPIGLTVSGGTLKSVMRSWSDWPLENLNQGGITVIASTLKVVLIGYSNWPQEPINLNGITITSGTLQ